MNTLTLQATFCGLLHGLGKLAFRADKTATGLLADLPDTPEWAAVRGGGPMLNSSNPSTSPASRAC